VSSRTRSPVFFDLTMISSTYASMMRPINSPKMRHMHRWKVEPVFLSPKGIVWYQYAPNGVMNEVVSCSTMHIAIWWYPEYASRK
jgi:hypothetical protein